MEPGTLGVGLWARRARRGAADFVPVASRARVRDRRFWYGQNVQYKLNVAKGLGGGNGFSYMTPRRSSLRAGPMQAKIKCVFFDRDGIVNRPPPPERRYVTHRDHFEMIPEFVDVLKLVRARGYEAVVVTNQSGIARGRMTENDVREIHEHLNGLLAARGAALLDIVMCPSDDDGHPDRKPNPGMLLTAAKRHAIDLPASWMVGDQERDIVAGQRAGCRTVLVAGDTKPTAAEFRVATMTELMRLLDKLL
jgi:histidinol-phosphate phosphatase family protein